MMKVLVVGATGVVGRPLLPLLRAEGWEVVGTSRSGRDGMRALDLVDPDAVKRLVDREKPDVAIHQATAIAGLIDLRKFDEGFAVTNRLRVEGTRNLIAAGVPRLIVQSYTCWPNERSGRRLKTEQDRLDPDPAANARLSHRAIVETEAMTTKAGGTVLRYGSFYGPGTGIAPDGALVQLVRKRQLPVIGDGGGVWTFLHVEDAARATVAAVRRQVSGILNVVDDHPAAAAEWIPELAAIAGAKRPWKVPGWLGRLAVGEIGMVMMTSARGSSNARAKAELGNWLKFGSWKDGFRTVLRG